MRLGTIRLFSVLAALTLLPSCDRAAAPTTSPTSAAYGDGFEVVAFDVRDGAPTSARSVPLKEAERAIAAGARAAIPGDPVAVQRQLSAGKSGDSSVLITVTPLDARKQQVRLTFHESSRTFVYENAVDGAKVAPLASEYRDLGKSKVVRYSGG
jgi:hypothetical protein